MQNGVPSRTLTSNLEFRTLPLFALSYGDENIKSLAGLFHRLTPGISKPQRAGPLDLLRVQEFEMVRMSGNAPELGTHLVRFRL